MKANELMIGDLIYRLCCFDQVKEIRQNGIIGLDSTRGLISFLQLEPIPLTPEILEKNGFKNDGEDKNMLYWNWSILEDCVSYDKETGIIRIFHCLGSLIFAHPLRYVHELQHALRLCGIEKEIIL